jgi:hypothetical protein
MALVIVTTAAFVGGMVCGESKSWKIWLPAAAVSGLAVGIAGRLLGVS